MSDIKNIKKEQAEIGAKLEKLQEDSAEVVNLLERSLTAASDVVEFEHSNRVKSIDSVIDIIKVLLSLTISILIALSAFPQITGDSQILLAILLIEVVVLIFLLHYRWSITEQSILQYKELQVKLMEIQSSHARNINSNQKREVESIAQKLASIKSQLKGNFEN